MDRIVEQARTFGLGRIALIGLVGVLALGGVLFIAMRQTEPVMQPLYSDLALADAGSVATALDELGIAYRVEGGGQSILVDPANAAVARMRLAELGLPNEASMGRGYELLNDVGAFGTTSYMQRLNRARALEGELERSIVMLDSVASARVHVVLPERESFSRSRAEPSASVIVEPTGQREITQTQADAIRHLVALAVPELTLERVAVTDTNGRVIAEREMGASGEAGDYRLRLEQDMERAIIDVLEPMAGMDSVRAQVALALNHEREVLRSEVFDPEGSVLRSVERDETRTQERNIADEPVTVENNLPFPDVTDEGIGSFRADEAARRVENFEISSEVRERVSDVPLIERINVAILVDSGTTQITPEMLARMEALAADAVGLDTARGDRITIEATAFQRPTTDGGAVFDDTPPGFWEANGLTIVQWAMIATVVLAGLFFLSRALMAPTRLEARLTSEMAESEETSSRPPVRVNEEGHRLDEDGNVMLDEDGRPMTAETAEQDQPKQKASEQLSEMLNMRNVDGEVQANMIKNLRTFVSENPADAVTIFKKWLYQ